MDDQSAALYQLLRDKALSYLVRREHSRHELKQKLLAKSEGDLETLTTVLQSLVDENSQSDARFAEHLCRYRVSAGKGPVKIAHELQMNQVDSAIIENVMSEYEHRWDTLAAELRSKKFGDQPPANYKEWARQARFLQQRGFESSQIGSYNE